MRTKQLFFHTYRYISAPAFAYHQGHRYTFFCRENIFLTGKTFYTYRYISAPAFTYHQGHRYASAPFPQDFSTGKTFYTYRYISAPGFAYHQGPDSLADAARTPPCAVFSAENALGPTMVSGTRIASRMPKSLYSRTQVPGRRLSSGGDLR